MDKVEELLRSRKWANDCLRVNIAQPDQIVTRGTSGKFKVAKVRSNLLRENEQELREAIKVIAPEWWDDETQVILNHNVQCKRHKDSSNMEHSWIIFMGDFTGGALCCDDGARFEEQYKWHKFDGHVYHWNEPHEGEKFSIVLYRNGAKKTKVQHIQDVLRPGGQTRRYRRSRNLTRHWTNSMRRSRGSWTRLPKSRRRTGMPSSKSW